MWLTRPAAPSRSLTRSAAELPERVCACLRGEPADESIPVTLFAVNSSFHYRCGELNIQACHQRRQGLGSGFLLLAGCRGTRV